MTGALRKGLVLLVLVFVLFYMFTDPHGLANLAKTGGGAIWSGLTALFQALIHFINSVTR